MPCLTIPVCTNCTYAVGAAFHNQGGCFCQRAGCIAYIINQHYILAGYVTNQRHRLNFIGAFTAFIAYYYLGIKNLANVRALYEPPISGDAIVRFLSLRLFYTVQKLSKRQGGQPDIKKSRLNLRLRVSHLSHGCGLMPAATNKLQPALLLWPTAFGLSCSCLA